MLIFVEETVQFFLCLGKSENSEPKNKIGTETQFDVRPLRRNFTQNYQKY